MKTILLILLLSFNGFTQTSTQILLLSGDDFNPIKLNPFCEIKLTSGITKNPNNKIIAWASTVNSYSFLQPDTALSPTYYADSVYFGTGDYMQIADANAGSFDFGTNDFSIEFWIKVNGTAEAVLLDKYATANPRYIVGYSPVGQEGKPSFTFRDATYGLDALYGTASINDGQWHHIIFSYNRDAGIYCYTDGVLTGSDETSAWTEKASVNMDNTSLVDFGTNAGAGASLGSVWVVRAYLKALTISEAKSLYSYGRK